MSMNNIRLRAHEARAKIEAGRREYAAIIREASHLGLSQRQIASLVHCSQPEVHRILHHRDKNAPPLTYHAKLLQKKGHWAKSIFDRYMFTNQRIYGSVARGEDTPESDINFLVTPLFNIPEERRQSLEAEVSRYVGAKVSVIFDTDLPPEYADQILAEAIPF